MSLQALHQSSRDKIQTIKRSNLVTTWSADQSPRRYRAADIDAGEIEPVIPAPDVFDSLKDTPEHQDKAVQDGIPSVGECAAHLELLEVFFKLRTDVVQRKELETVFGVKQEHRVVYRERPRWQRKLKREPVTLKDPNWDEKRRKKWPYFLTLAVQRFETWADKAGSTVTGEGEALHLRYLPPIDILLVWHAFLLNPQYFSQYCNTPSLRRLRQVPFPWLAIHNAIDHRDFAFTLPDESADWFRTTFHLDPDLLRFLTKASRARKPDTDPILRATTLFGTNALSTRVLTALLDSIPSKTPQPTRTFLHQIYFSQLHKTRHTKLADNVHRQSAFINKMHLHLWVRAPSLKGTLRRAVARYDDFVRLFALAPGTTLVPTLDIDLVWHTHQLSAMGYEKCMRARTGRFIDHDDKIKKGALNTGLQKTKDLWAVRIGGGYERCLCWDCEALLDAFEDEEDGNGEEGGVDGVVERVRGAVEYHRLVEISRRRRDVRLPIRVDLEEQTPGKRYMTVV